MEMKQTINFTRYPITFEIDGDIGGCCGTAVITDLRHVKQKEELVPGANWWTYKTNYKKVKPKKSREIVHNKFLEEVTKRLNWLLKGGKYSGGLLASVVLITKYFSKVKPDNEGQCPGLAQFLENNGWNKGQVWVNKNTGNELTLLTKVILDNKEPGKYLGKDEPYDFFADGEDEDF